MRGPGPLTFALAAAAATATSACSLVVADIELPAESSGPTADDGLRRDADVEDAALPAPDGDVAPGPDAARPPADAAAPPGDAAAPKPDVATPPGDAFVTPPDAWSPPPDAFVPEPDAFVPPPVDLSAIAGFWYLHGVTPGVDGRLEAFTAALRIEPRRVTLLNDQARPVPGEVNLTLAGDLYGTWRLTLPTTDTVYRGAFAPTSGFAVFAPDARQAGAPASVLLLARVNDEVPATVPDTFGYSVIGRDPGAGDGEVGILRQLDPMAFVQENRFPAPPTPGTLPDRTLEFWPIDPWRNMLYDPETGTEIEVVPTAQGLGVIGVERRLGEAGTGLLLGWVPRPPPGLPRAGDLFCGGARYDDAAATAVPLSLSATMTGDGAIQWVGGFEQHITLDGSTYFLDGGLNPFLRNNGLALADGWDEVFTVLSVDPLRADIVWGLLTCVRTDLVPVPI
ncbi:hypothetical protein L6V77_19950 [Myxococcota bacterium]|nr:hypothetical protein [Myxococcota bacterium]